MKCPYTDCRKDYNPNWSDNKKFIDPSVKSEEGDGLLVKSLQCRFCGRYFHEIYRRVSYKYTDNISDRTKELLFTFPGAKTKFEAKKIPKEIKNNFNEAERCRSVGSLTGIGACLRKTVYALCDDQGVEGENYRDKIRNLPVKGKYQELLKQIKWLGDNTTKPGEEKYTMEDADLAIEILPMLIDELYVNDEKIDEVEKILAKARSSKDSKS